MLFSSKLHFMNKRTNVLVALTIFVTTFGFAQKQTDSLQVEQLEEVVITDSRFELKRENSGKTVISISAKELENNQGRTIADIINDKSGITINGANSQAGQPLTTFVRGGQNRQVLVLIDGIAVSDPSQIENNFDLQLLSPDQIESIEILKNLTKQYQNDADLFYLLGLSYYETGQFKNAIIVLKKTLESGGTILRGIPTGSAPSNDIMIKVAKAYAEDGDKENALLWLQKGFASRYDEKPFLKGDPAFKNFNTDDEFLALFGNDNQTKITREESWTKDLSYLEKRINELHYSPNHSISKTELSKEFQNLKTKIATLNDEQIVVELMKIVGSLGNGHNLIIPTSPKKGALKILVYIVSERGMTKMLH